MKKHLISILSIFFLVFTGKFFISSSPSESSAEYQELFENRYKVFALNLPRRIEFAGERVPMEIRDVEERLDRELHVNTYWQSSTLLLIKRSNRYFPIIRPILKKHGIPDDFKYLPIIESGFQDVVSPAGAEGPWQFMPETGKLYGLQINEQVDERYHIAKATEAACKYFKDAYKMFHNWTLVAASYNSGVYGLDKARKRQKVDTYYDLSLNQETARYIFRLLAMKEIMEHPDQYGFQYRKYHLYQRVPTYRVKVDSSINDLVAFAAGQGINLKVLKEMNPWLKGDKMMNPDGRTYYLEIPKVKTPKQATVEEDSLVYNVDIPKPTFLVDSHDVKKNLSSGKIVSPSSLITYTVKKGDEIEKLAAKFGVKVFQIMEWNGLEKSELKKGQVLKIYQQPIEKEK